MFCVVCVLLIIMVLLQKGRGGGLGAAFGGAGSSAFGTRTGDVFTWVTIVLTGLFLLLAVGSTLAFRPPPGKVATPRVSVTGPISSETVVIISCGTVGAKIAATIDGSDPQEKDAEKSQVHVYVNPGQTVKARGYRKNWKTSELLSLEYNAPEALAPVETLAPLPTTQPASTE